MHTESIQKLRFGYSGIMSLEYKKIFTKFQQISCFNEQKHWHMIPIKEYIIKFWNYRHSKHRYEILKGNSNSPEVWSCFFFFYNIIFALYFDIATYILTILHMEYNIASLTLSGKVIFLNPWRNAKSKSLSNFCETSQNLWDGINQVKGI